MGGSVPDGCRNDFLVFWGRLWHRLTAQAVQEDAERLANRRSFVF